MRISLAIGVALAMAAPAILLAGEPQVGPEQAVADPPAAADIINLNSDKSRRMFIDVNIEGKGPYPFIVDTASQGTVIARELADQLALREGARSKLHSMGASESVQTVIIPHLAANKLVVRKIVAPALTQYNIGAAGILGLDALRSQRMLLDFGAGRMTLAPSAEPQENWQGEFIVVTARSRLGQLILTDATIGDEHVDVILDTGGEVSVGNLALRRRLLTRHAANSDTPHRIQLIDVTGNIIQLDYAIVDHLRIANLSFENLPVAFADAHMFQVLGLTRTPSLLLGMDALQLFGRVSVDFGNKKVRFQRSEADVTAASRRPVESDEGQIPAAQ